MATNQKVKPAVNKAAVGLANTLTPAVNYMRPEVVDLMPRWQKIRDCVAGQTKIKEKRTEYLPAPNSTDTSHENKTRYNDYLLRAIFYNVVGWTLKGLLGEVFKKLPVLTIPASLEVLKIDVDGAGVELDQQAQRTLANVLQFGRAGLLADYPKVEGVTTQAQVDAGLNRPTITFFHPWDIINWRVVTVGGKKLLSLVVINETFVTDDDGFHAREEERFRVLRLVNGVYQVEIWIWDETASKYIQNEIYLPTDGSGQTWKFIPFQFVGVENNDSIPDLPPLYDMAEINLGHYRNSADYEELTYIVGQPTPVLTGLTEEWVQKVLKGTIQLGSRALIPLPVGASAELLQVQVGGSTLPMEAMKHKEDQMKALGAKLLEPGGVQKTATQVSVESASETSLLASCAKNVSMAYENAIEWCGLFINEVGEVSYELSTDFEEGLTPADLPNLIAAWQARAISQTEMRDGMRNAGVAWQTDDEYKTSLDSEGPDMGLPVDPNAQATADANAKLALEQAKAAAKQNASPTPAA